MGSILSALGFLSKVFDFVVGFFHDKGVQTAQKNADDLKEKTSDLSEIKGAQDARADVDRTINNDGARMQLDDPNASKVGPDGVS